MRQAENWERVPWYNYDNTRATELTMVQDWSVCVSCFARGEHTVDQAKSHFIRALFSSITAIAIILSTKSLCGILNIILSDEQWEWRDVLSIWIDGKQRIHSFAIPTYISDTNLDSWAKYLPWHNSSLRFRWWIALLTNIQASIIGIYWLQTIKRIKRKEEYEKNHIQPLSLKANRIC